MAKKELVVRPGFAYTDEHGYSHVTGNLQTAIRFGIPGSIQNYTGLYSGGYARDKEGNRVALATKNVRAYGNDYDAKAGVSRTVFSGDGLGDVLA